MRAREGRDAGGCGGLQNSPFSAAFVAREIECVREGSGSWRMKLERGKALRRQRGRDVEHFVY